MDLEDLTSFDKLITPQYIQVLFWIGVAASVLAGIGIIIGNFFPPLLGVAVLVAGPVLTRVGCELLVLAFKVVDWIAEIKITLAKQQQQLAARQPSAPLREDGSSTSRAETPSTEASSPDAATSPSSQ